MVISHPIDADSLLGALAEGKDLAQEDLRAIGEALEAHASGYPTGNLSIDDLYAYLIILGRSGQSQFRYIIEHYLDDTDPLTAAQALKTLCIDWALREEYLERVFGFALGTPQDPEEDVRQVAFEILGLYLQNAFDWLRETDMKSERKITENQFRVGELLLSSFPDTELQPWTRQAAYVALCNAWGENEEDLPPACAVLDLSLDSDDLNQEMLQKLRTLFSAYSSSPSSNPSDEEIELNSEPSRPSGMR